MKIILTLTLEVKRSPKTKKSPAPQKPTAQSNSNTTVIIGQK